MATGIRVIRGPDWSGGDLDGGEGHVGTVVQYGSNGSAQVIWDNGKEMAVKIGQGGKYELRILDTAPIGVRHTTHQCDSCDEMGVAGFRWRCGECADFDLCSVCYVTDQHNLTHQFLRIDKEGGEGVRVSQRNKSMKVRAMGLYPGATVTRGRHWNSGDQDGGQGSEGVVTELVTPGTRSARSAVRVRWGSGQEHTYRVGQDGKVDLQFTEEGQGIEYYPQHLPNLDSAALYAPPPASASSDTGLKEGDKVSVELDEAGLKALHRAAGSWSAGMSKLIGQVGVIKSFSPDGSVSVQFGTQKYKILPAALKKISEFCIGDMVRILEDADKVKLLQDDHGGWLDDMRPILGKVGRVVKKDSEGDVVVSFGGRSWLFNPACCLPAPGSKEDEAGEVNSAPSGTTLEDLSAMPGDLANLLRGLIMMSAGVSQAQSGLGFGLLIKAIQQGSMADVRGLLEREPSLIRYTKDGLTALHIAAHEGQLDIVKLLLDRGADKDAADKDGDTPLHIALIKQEKRVSEFLIEAGVDVNKMNVKRRQALHNAAYFDMTSVIHLLIRRGCDVNTADADGDTPIFDAIGKENMNAFEAILTAPKLNLKSTNKKGFTPIHMTAFKGLARMTEKILVKDRATGDLKKEDGFTPLHLAAFNDHTDVARVLIRLGRADVNSKNNKGETPLHLCSTEAYTEPVHCLVENNANINAKNNDGDTPLHNLLKGNQEGLMLRLLIGQPPRNDEELRVRLGCYLLQHGADRSIPNRQGQTPVDVCRSAVVKQAVVSFSRTVSPATRPSSTAQSAQRPSSTTSSTRGNTSPRQDGPKLCNKCMDIRANAVYLPCGHKEVCRKCSLSMRMCGICGNGVTARVGEDGKKIKDCVIM